MTRRQRATWILAGSILLAAGVVIGIFVWRVYFAYIPSRYPSTFHEGQWLIAPGDAPQGYFRRELYVAGGIRAAWIMVAGTDSFSLYLNGEHIASEGFPLRQVSGIYDIARHLRPGLNVIGARVTRVTYPGAAAVAIEGRYVDQAGGVHLIASDASWKASSHEDSQGDGSIRWQATTFLADAWPTARLGGLPSAAEVSPISLPPDLIRLPPQGQWVGHIDPQARAAIFQHTFTLMQRVQGAWVRLAADEGYELAINGVPMGSSGARTKVLDVYDIGPFLRRGPNTITLHVIAPQASAPRVIADILYAQANRVERIAATDASWQSRRSAETEAKTLQQGRYDWAPAVILGEYAPWIDRLVKTPLEALLPLGYVVKQAVHMAFCMSVMVLTLLVTSVACSRLLQRLRPEFGAAEAFLVEAILHLPSLLFLGVLYWLQFDSRFDGSFPYRESFLVTAVGALWFARLATLVEAWLRPRPIGRTQASIFWPGLRVVGHRYRAFGLVVCIVGIVLVGFAIRVSRLEATSLSHDEAGMALLARQIVEQGYPSRTIGPLEKSLTTYELLPYPIALTIRFLGSSEFAIRLPAAIFATLTTALMAYIGMRLWDVWVGLLAATIYAFSPFSILWGTNAFHPQQTQFFALLTTYLLYQSLWHAPSARQRGYLYGGAACMILTYLTWEGTGLLLPALFIAFHAAKGRNWRWLRSPHLWVAVGLVSVVVILQYSRRILLNVPYIVVGKGLSDSGFALFFLDPLYDPWFYLRNFLCAGNHLVLSAAILCGISLVISHSATRYYVTLLIILISLLNNFVPNLSTRYMYFTQPFLILGASSVVVIFLRYVIVLSRTCILSIPNSVRNSLPIILIPIVFSATNMTIANTYNLSSSQEWIKQMSPGIYWIDYRDASYFIRHHIMPEDIVISSMPQTLEFYNNPSKGYYLQSYTDRQIFYDISDMSKSYLDKYVGNRVIRNIQELKDVMNNYKTVYILAAPSHAFNESNDNSVKEYIEKNTKIIQEGYKTRIYIWDR